MWGEEGEGEMYGERNMKTDITMEVVSQTVNGNLLMTQGTQTGAL